MLREELEQMRYKVKSDQERAVEKAEDRALKIKSDGNLGKL